MDSNVKARVFAALEILNNVYGRGYVQTVDFDSHIVTVRLQYGSHNYKYEFDGTTVFYRDHQLKIDSPKVKRLAEDNQK